MSVVSGRGMRTDSFSESTESNKQSSTLVACSLNSATLTPAPSHDAPRGYGLPGHTRMRIGLPSQESAPAAAPSQNGGAPVPTTHAQRGLVRVRLANRVPIGPNREARASQRILPA